MAFITCLLTRSGLTRKNPIVNGTETNAAYFRWFSGKVMGPSPEDILKTSDVGHKYYMRNLEKFRADGKINYSIPEQFNRMPKEDIEIFKALFQDLLRKNEDLFKEIKSLNAKVDQLICAPRKN